MSTQKQWNKGQGVLVYSDLSGSHKYTEAGIPVDYIQDTLASAIQHSFRFFNNDGSESASTAKAALNTNLTLSINDIARIRFLVDSIKSIGPKEFTIECRHKPSGGSFGPWEPIA